MIKADEQLATALARLQNSDDFQAVKTWIGASINYYLRGLVDVEPGAKTEYAKGYCGALIDILDKFSAGQKLVDRFKR